MVFKGLNFVFIGLQKITSETKLDILQTIIKFLYNLNFSLDKSSLISKYAYYV
jgi:hypothetical protein